MNDQPNLAPYTPHTKGPFQLALRLSFPAFLSYISLGIVFAVLFNQLHDPWYFAPIMSLFAYSGAVQFVTIGIMAIHGSYWMILVSTIFIAARNSFYGLSFLKRFQVNGWRKVYLIFTLVDANYAIMVTHPPYQDKKQDTQFCLYLSFFTHLYWVLGTFVGAIFSNKLPQLQDLEFVLIAFFSILVFEQFLRTRCVEPIAVGVIAAVIALILVPLKLMLPLAITLSCMGLLLLYFREKKNGLI